MDSFPIHKNEQSMFFFFYTVSVSSYRRTNKKTDVLSHLYMLTNCFPIDKAPECRSSMEACRVQTKELECVQITTKNKSAEQIIPKCWCALVQAWHSDRFKGQHWSLSGLFVAFSLCPLLVIAYQLLGDTDLKISHFQRSLSVASPRFMWVS